MSKEEININWEGPFNIDEIIEGEINSQDYDVKSNDIGLYQIYGSHPLYGDGVLVYIGRTANKNGFESRLKNRWVIENGTDSKNVKIYLGTIFSTHNKLTEDEKIKKIEKAEVLLINAMKPAFNSSNIQSAKEFDKDYIVNNYNSFRSLYPVLSSDYFWQDTANIKFVDKLVQKLKINIEDFTNDNHFYGFALKENDNICFGVDYDYWNKHDVPLVIGVYKKAIDDVAILEEFSFEIEKDTDDDYYFLPIPIDNWEDETSMDAISTKLKEIHGLL